VSINLSMPCEMSVFLKTACADFDAFTGRQPGPLEIGVFAYVFCGVVFSAEKVSFTPHPGTFFADWTNFHIMLIMLS